MQLMKESVDLLIYGMGIVFCFLILLVGSTVVMSVVVNRFFPQPEPLPAVGRAKTSGVDSLTIKIIQAAVDKHRGNQ